MTADAGAVAYAAFHDEERRRLETVPADLLWPETTGAEPEVIAAITAEVERVDPLLRRIATELHARPEIGFEEHFAVATITGVLRDSGFEVEQPAFGLDTAFRVTVGSGTPHVAVLAEYDALPGVGHACGHNILGAWSVGSFLGLAAVADRLGGTVTLIGTPAEENGGGKDIILRAGGFAGVDAVGILHPGSGVESFGILGAHSSGIRAYEVTYRGRAAHAAVAPEFGRNALDGAVSAYLGLAQLRQHILPGESINVVISDGGEAPNVIPERAGLRVYVRSPELSLLEHLTARVRGVFDGAALVTGTEVEVTEERPPYLPLRNNIPLTQRWARSAERFGYTVPTGALGPRVGGPSNDVGNVSQHVPTFHTGFGIGSPPEIGPHDPRFAEHTIGEAALATLTVGAASTAHALADFLADPALREQVAADFARDGGRTYG